jgi:hypothetical protein
VGVLGEFLRGVAGPANEVRINLLRGRVAMISTKAEEERRSRNIVTVHDPEAVDGEVKGIAREVTPESTHVAQMEYVLVEGTVLCKKPSPELKTSQLATPEGRERVRRIVRERMEANGAVEMRRLENAAAVQRKSLSTPDSVRLRQGR